MFKISKNKLNQAIFTQNFNLTCYNRFDPIIKKIVLFFSIFYEGKKQVRMKGGENQFPNGGKNGSNFGPWKKSRKKWE